MWKMSILSNISSLSTYVLVNILKHISTLDIYYRFIEVTIKYYSSN